MFDNEIAINGYRNENFIRAYNAFSKDNCDEIIAFFENSDKKKEGITLGGVNKSIKDSIDLAFMPNAEDKIFQYYLQELWQKAVIPYAWQFCQGLIDSADNLVIKEPVNIQKYNPKGGFKTYHHESCSSNSADRVLVFMTYLNYCNGGTRFLYQGVDIIPSPGLTIIWPAGFTHVHKGLIDDENTKYIITGWINYK